MNAAGLTDNPHRCREVAVILGLSGLHSDAGLFRDWAAVVPHVPGTDEEVRMRRDPGCPLLTQQPSWQTHPLLSRNHEVTQGRQDVRLRVS